MAKRIAAASGATRQTAQYGVHLLLLRGVDPPRGARHFPCSVLSKGARVNQLRNLITDVPGVLVGNAQDARLASGATAVVFEAPAVGSIDVRGGGPGTRETALLDPAQTVQGIDAIALSGGSAFGLDAASGVQAWLREQGRGFAVRSARVPIVPGAILFDLLNGGDKDWGRYPPYRELGYQAAARRRDSIRSGQRGRGPRRHHGQSQGWPRFGFALRATVLRSGALAAVNAAGSVVAGDGPWFWAAPFERDGEYRRTRLAAVTARGRAGPGHQGQPAHQHHAGGRGNRCGAHQGASQAPRRDGPDRLRARHLSRAHAARRRRGVRRVDRAQAARRPDAGAHGARHGRRQLLGPRHCARGL